MRDPKDFSRDWGPWGWVWALGLWAFLLGLLLVVHALPGSVSWATVPISASGALLMRVALGAGESTG